MKSHIHAELIAIETRTVIAVMGCPEMLDSHLEPFMPDEVTLIQRTRSGLTWVGIRGRRTENGLNTETGFAVSLSCQIERNKHSNEMPPDWLDDVVERLAAGEFREGVHVAHPSPRRVP